MGRQLLSRFAVHPKQTDKDYNGSKDLPKLKIYQYGFKMGLKAYPSGATYNYANNEVSNITTLSKIMQAIKNKAIPVTEEFKASPNILEQYKVAEMDNFYTNWTKRTGVSIATTNIRFAWAMARILENKNLYRAKQFARWGL